MNTQVADNSKAIALKALASAGQIATLPEVTLKVMEVVEDPKGTTAQLHDVIKRDPALSGKVLSVVNSAFYGLPGQVASLDRAIILLGGAAVKNISVAASLGHMFVGSQKLGQFDLKSLWKHSIAVAVAAKAICGAARAALPGDEVFLAGLLHDLGLLIERQVYPDKLGEVATTCGSDGRSFIQIERDALGATHQDFGDALTAKWKFPPRLRAVIGAHHNPEELPEEHSLLGTIIYCADTICCQERIGFDLTACNQTLSQEQLDKIGVTEVKLQEVREGLADGVAEAEAVLGSNS